MFFRGGEEYGTGSGVCPMLFSKFALFFPKGYFEILRLSHTNTGSASSRKYEQLWIFKNQKDSVLVVHGLTGK
jgi:hypothetical protein